MTEIEQLRNEIRNLDTDIIKNIALRQSLCKELGKLKIQTGKAIVDLAQENKNFAFYESLSQKYGIDPGFISSLFELIIMNARAVQQSSR